MTHLPGGPIPRVAILREEGSNGDREMADAFHLAGFEVNPAPGKAGDLHLVLTVCPLSFLPVILGVGCDHAGSLLWGHQAGHIPWCGLCGRLQLRRRPGLCQRSVQTTASAVSTSLVKRLWLLLPRMRPPCCPHKRAECCGSGPGLAGGRRLAGFPELYLLRRHVSSTVDCPSTWSDCPVLWKVVQHN